MRINRFVAQATGLSRRAADEVIAKGRVMVNGHSAQTGQSVQPADRVMFDGNQLMVQPTVTIILNKPPGFVSSRDGQGSQTVYDLLPTEFHQLKPVGRLDKDSSGLLLLTNDGELAQQLTHPTHQKSKVYTVSLNKALQPADQNQIAAGVSLADGLSQLDLSGHGLQWIVTMQEGRNRQIRRTFESLGYRVVQLHRTQFGPYQLNDLQSGKFKIL